MRQESCNNYESLNPDSSAARQTKKSFFTKGRIIALSIAAVIIGLCIWDIADPPLWWQFQAQKNKRTVMKYVNEHYPGAKLVQQHYRSTSIDPYEFRIDSFTFEWNDICFWIQVERERISDFYWVAYADRKVYDSYLKSFFETRNITAKISYPGYSTPTITSFFEENPEADISQFEGKINLVIHPNIDDAHTTPESFGWLYDFYCHCKENITIRYSVNITCKNSSINFNNETVYNNEKEFYDAFSTG
ncbi:MAG: hypothetical protein HDT42_10205 [Ruminococcaceae bacterium]|nr:hypothetical protein [Oscillospiraceae bacterium]